MRKYQNLTMSTSVHLKEKLIHYDSYVDQKPSTNIVIFMPPPQAIALKAGPNL